jgi:hypothetical protein
LTQYPRHTWQSWRDRYLKRLQGLPPSAFNILDNPVPNKPALVKNKDKAVETTLAKKSRRIKNKDKAQVVSAGEESTNVRIPSSKAQTTGKEDYTVDQLAATFSTEDWENLYAFVEEIESCSKEDNSYDQAWTDWAEDRDNQTAEQWQQYYEKIVRPQWLRDPISKRQQIRKKVEERVQNNSPSPAKSVSWSQAQDKAVAAAQVVEPAPTDPPKRAVSSNISPSDTRLESEATAHQETPKHVREGYESAPKRIRGEADDTLVPKGTDRPAKIQKRISLSPTPAETEQPVEVIGTQEQPPRISLIASSQRADIEQRAQRDQRPVSDVGGAIHEADESKDEEHNYDNDPYGAVYPATGSHPEQAKRPAFPPGYLKWMRDQGGERRREMKAKGMTPEKFYMPDATSQRTDQDNDSESIASSTDLTHIAPLPRPPRIPEDDDDEDDLAPNTPTPRATKVANFDTQAILFPSQHPARISELPRPALDSSPPHHPESDASTTQSLQEFSSYLEENAQYDQIQTQPPLTHLPRPASPTPSATSEASSSGSEDPDEPLAADEIENFFAEQHSEGFSDEYITKALKRTRFRPGLAVAVLDAWKHGRPLPNQRGIWDIKEDEDVKNGDGAALERLERKHTLDGWGGITERINFLRAWERR